MNSFIFPEQKSIDLSLPESSILDCNKGEKYITEFNNLICLGQYELAHPFFKQIIGIVPAYIEYFYKLIFLRGIPSKWLLNNQLRTSSHYLWILYQDYHNDFKQIPSCPIIQFKKHVIKSIEFDLLITNAFYYSYELTTHNQVDLEFLFDLRNFYNYFHSLAVNENYYLSELRLLSPNPKQISLYLSIKGCSYDKSEGIIDFSNSQSFFNNMKKMILTQPLLSSAIIEQIFSNFKSLDMKRKDIIQLWENVHVIYGTFIMLFIYLKDYEKCYDYLKLLPYNDNIDLCKKYTMMLFSVIVMIYSNQGKNEEDFPNEVWKFVSFCLKKLLISPQESSHLSGFKYLPYFNSNKSNCKYDTIENEKIVWEYYNKEYTNKTYVFMKNKIFEALLANRHRELISKLSLINDFYIEFQCSYVDIPFFFPTYQTNINKTDFYQSLSYDQLQSLIFQASSNKTNNTIDVLWSKANNHIFWNYYLNFLRIQKRHCLGYGLTEAISYIEKGKFDNAVTLLHPMNNLKLLLIIFVWNKFDNDIEIRRKLLNVFWNSFLNLNSSSNDNSYTFISLFKNIIINLDYFINYSTWIQRKNNLNPNIIYNQLLLNSIPCVMKPYMLDFDYKDIVQTFISYFPKGNKTLQRNHFHSSMMVFSFFIYHYIFKRIDDNYNNYLEGNNTNEQLFNQGDINEIKGMLHKVLLFPYRLNLLVDLFSLVLIPIDKYTDQKEKEATEYNAQQKINNQKQHVLSLYHKRVFIQMIQLLHCGIEPITKFNINSNSQMIEMFNPEFIDESITNMIDIANNKALFVEDLPLIDTEFLVKRENNKNIDYKIFLITKSKELKSNFEELIFRFNIVNNPWLEIINEEHSFLDTLCQTNEEYLQIAKKFHMFSVCHKTISFFQLNNESKRKNDIDQLETFISLKKDMETHANNYDSIIDSLLNTTDNLNNSFESFKKLFNLSFCDNLSADTSIALIDKSLLYLEKSNNQDISLFQELIEKYKALIDPSITTKVSESLSQIVVSTKNSGVVQKATTTDKMKMHISFLKTQEKAIQTLYDKVTTEKALKIPYEELKTYFDVAFSNIKNYEQYTQPEENGSSKDTTYNYLFIFLKYLMTLGDAYQSSKQKLKPESSCNYLRILKKYPKEIIAKLLLKYNNENQAIVISKMTRTNIITVFIEYTNYYKQKVVNFNDFNSLFSTIINNIKASQNIIEELNALPDKEEWIQSSPKTFNISMRILEYIYELNYNQYVPFFVSLYRINYDTLTNEAQYIFWKLLIEKYSKCKVFNQYIKEMYFKFYLSRLISHKDNDQFKGLFDIINSNTSMNYQIKENQSYVNLYEKVSKRETTKIIPPTFKYMKHTSNDYINKLKGKLSNYLEDKVKNNKRKGTDISIISKNYRVPMNKFHDIQNMSFTKNKAYYENVCNELIEMKQFDLCLEIAETHLGNIKSDIIEKIIYNYILIGKTSEEKLYKLIIKMQNKEVMFSFIKQLIFKWQPETSLKILYILKESIPTEEQLTLISKLEIFNEILQKQILSNYTLQVLFNECDTNLNFIIDKLMNKNAHYLCYELLKVFHQYDTYKTKVQFSEIKLLLSTNDISNKILALEKLNKVEEDPISFYLKLIDEIDNYQNKLLVIKFIINNYKEDLSVNVLDMLQKKEIAIKIYFLIPIEIQKKILDIIDFPELIIETLIINKKFEVIDNIFYYFPQIKSNEIILFYAKKAMDINICTANIIINNDPLSNEYFELVTDKNKATFRKTFIFNKAPCFDLFKHIMELCDDFFLFSETCLEVSNNCSKLLTPNTTLQQKMIYINFIDKMLQYINGKGKSKSMLKTNNQRLKTYEKLNNLYKEFIIHGIDSFIEFELDKIYNNPEYQIEIRDQLIKNDYLILSETYCNELNIDSRQVDREIGLFYIKNRNFPNAKRVLTKILPENSQCNNIMNNISISNKQLSPEDCFEVIDQIITILNGKFNLTIKELEHIHSYLLLHNECSIIPKEVKTLKVLSQYKEYSLNSQKNILYTDSSLLLKSNPIELSKTMDILLFDQYLQYEKQFIIKETLFYVKTYGTIKQLLNFYVDNNMLSESFDYIIEQKVPTEIVIDEIVRKCFIKNKMDYFRHSLKMSIEKLNKSKSGNDLTMQIINFLKTENAHEELIKLYELLDLNLEAMLESVHIIKRTEDIDIKMAYYIKGEHNLTVFLNNNNSTFIQMKESINDDTHSNRMVDRKSLIKILKLLRFQIEVMKTKKEIQFTLITDKEEDMYSICQEIIILNDSLALELVTEYGLLLNQIFLNATSEMIGGKKFHEFEALLGIVAKWDNEGILKKLNENKNALWNDILTLAISQLPSDDEENKIYIKENIIQRMTDDFLRMQSLYLIGEYENALTLAFQSKNTGLIEDIKQIAIANDMKDLIVFINDMLS